MSSVQDPQMLQHMLNCILLPPSPTRSCPLRGSRSPSAPTTEQANIAIFISAGGNHCKATDPAENRALIAVPLKPNVIASDKPHPKVQRANSCRMFLQCMDKHADQEMRKESMFCISLCYMNKLHK